MFGRFHARSAAFLTLAALLLSGDSRSWAAQSEPKAAAEADSPEPVIRRALAKPVKLKFVRTPLADVANSLEETLGVQVRLDRRALDDVGIGADIPITFEVSGISARSALELMLRQLDLTWIIAYELLLITTPEEAETTLTTKVYDVADLVVRENESQWPDFESLMDLVTACIEPDSWDSVGGPGSVAPFQADGITAIVFSQTQDVHEKVAILLEDLRKIRRKKTGEPRAGQNGATPNANSPAKHQGPQEREDAIRRALAMRGTMKFAERPLPDVLEFLRQTANIRSVIDHRALDDIGVGSDVPVTVQVSKVTLRSALDLMLRPPDLTWTISREVLLITTPEEAQTMLQAEVYDVSDLLPSRDTPNGPIRDFDSLISTITTTVEPESWDSVGGPGSIAPFEADGIQVLIVSQTWKLHEQIEALLDGLRKSRGQRLGN